WGGVWGGGGEGVVGSRRWVVGGRAAALQPEVRDHEPAVALFGGADGLDLVTRLVADAPSRLRRGSLLAFEFGCGQDAEVERRIAGAPDLSLVAIRRDLDGIARAAVAQKT